MVLCITVDRYRREIRGLSRSQVKAILRKIGPEAKITLKKYMAVIGSGTPSKVFAYREQSGGSDPYLKTVPGRVNGWMIDVGSILSMRDSRTWIVTYMRLVEGQSWKDVCQPLRLTEAHGKALMEDAIFLLVYEMRDRGIPTRP